MAEKVLSWVLLMVRGVNVASAVLALAATASCSWLIEPGGNPGVDDGGAGSDADPTESLCTARGRGLIAWYRLESANLLFVDDDSGHDYDAQCPVTTSCPQVFINGHLGAAMRFTTASDELTIDDGNGAFSPESGFTVAAFLGYGGGGEQVIASKALGSSAHSWTLGIQNGGNLSAQAGTLSENQDVAVVSLDPLAVGVWSHVALTWAGFDSPLRLFINGEMVAASDSSKAVAFDSGAVTIGAQMGQLMTAGKHLQSVLDEVRFYSRALAPAEVDEIAHCGGALGIELSP